MAPTGLLQGKAPAPRAASQPAPAPVAILTGLVRTLTNQEPPIDHARIAQIRQAIASGTYRPETEAIAQAMLRHYGWAGE